jgi:hypothetical protein
MSSLAKAGISHPGMSEIEREYANKKLTLLKLGDNPLEDADGILVPEEVAREMQRLSEEVFLLCFTAAGCVRKSHINGFVDSCG